MILEMIFGGLALSAIAYVVAKTTKKTKPTEYTVHILVAQREETIGDHKFTIVKKHEPVYLLDGEQRALISFDGGLRRSNHELANKMDMQVMGHNIVLTIYPNDFKATVIEK